MEIMFAQLSLVTAWNFAEDSRKTLMFGTSKLFPEGQLLQNSSMKQSTGDADKALLHMKKLLNEIKTTLKPARFI
jgi:hypothetical protein